MTYLVWSESLAEARAWAREHLRLPGPDIKVMRPDGSYALWRFVDDVYKLGGVEGPWRRPSTPYRLECTGSEGNRPKYGEERDYLISRGLLGPPP